MTEIGAMQIKDVLGNDFIQWSSQEKIDFFFT